jgi:hypothetical protein
MTGHHAHGAPLDQFPVDLAVGAAPFFFRKRIFRGGQVLVIVRQTLTGEML